MQQTFAELDSRKSDESALLTRLPSTRQNRQWRPLVVALLTIDAIAIATGFALAYFIRFKLGLPLLETPPHRLHFYSTVVFAAVPVWLIVFAAYRLYDRQHLFGGLREYTAIVNACTIGMMGVIVASFLEPTLSISRGWLLLAWMLANAVVGATRFSIRRIVYRLRQRGLFMEDAIIVGANEEASALAEHLHATRVAGLRIVGAVDDIVPLGTQLTDGIQVIGKLKELESLVNKYGITELLVAPTALSRDDLLDVYRTIGRQRDIHLRMSSGLFEILTTGVSVKQVGGLPLISPEKFRIKGVDAAMKSVLDYSGAVFGLLFSSPLIALLALLIRLDSPGPVFHRRRVLGRGGRPFDALKFRTMVVNADEVLNTTPSLREKFEIGFKLKDDPRITRVGRFLRRTSLDELPQLINILLGQMSLVGPRMIAPEEACRYGKWQYNLLTVKPGITGPWQVNGRNGLTYDERVKLSMHYIRNYTIWLDIQIIFQTVPVVLLRKGAY